MINQPLKAEITQLLTRLETVRSEFNEELSDTLSREILFNALRHGFIEPQADFVLTRQFSMDDPQANDAIYAAMTEFLSTANAQASSLGLITPQQRIAAFFADAQGKEGNEVDEFFGWMEPEDWKA